MFLFVALIVYLRYFFCVDLFNSVVISIFEDGGLLMLYFCFLIVCALCCSLDVFCGCVRFVRFCVSMWLVLCLWHYASVMLLSDCLLIFVSRLVMWCCVWYLCLCLCLCCFVCYVCFYCLLLLFGVFCWFVACVFLFGFFLFVVVLLWVLLCVTLIPLFW